ncbi:MAG: hypothetical protein IRY92_02320 [Dactylosporangium sp.]|nr:hypothetical protein [Dactylosporangium sp.]
MAQRITVQIWRGEKQVYAEPDRITAAAVRKLRSLGFTQNAQTGRWQYKCGAKYVDQALAEFSEMPGFVVVDKAPEGDPLTWRDRPVSKRQMELLARLGIQLPEGANRGIASDLISQAIDRR